MIMVGRKSKLRLFVHFIYIFEMNCFQCCSISLQSEMFLVYPPHIEYLNRVKVIIASQSR